jgi:hypothetical protein
LDAAISDAIRPTVRLTPAERDALWQSLRAKAQAALDAQTITAFPAASIDFYLDDESTPCCEHAESDPLIARALMALTARIEGWAHFLFADEILLDRARVHPVLFHPSITMFGNYVLKGA